MGTDELEKLLPADYEQACYDTKAISRKRTIKSPMDLLVLILYYLSGNKSLIDVSQFALMRGIGKISDVAFMNRFVKCKDWIIWLTEHILPSPIIRYGKPDWLKPYRVIAVDASDIVEKGAAKRLWHLHYAVDLFSLTCNQFKLTRQSTGESLKNFSLQPGYLVLADRIYGTLTGIEYCLNSGAAFIIRLRNKAFTMYDSQGKRVILADWLKNIGQEARECLVYVKNSNKELVPIRVCAQKKTPEAIAAGTKRQKRQDVRRQRKTKEDTKFTSQYIFVITSLPATVPAKDVLACYRLRWQVELVFKRMKSLLQLGNIPTKTTESAEVWINGKILVALLTEQYLGDIDFSPSGISGSGEEHLERNETGFIFDFLNAPPKSPSEP